MTGYTVRVLLLGPLEIHTRAADITPSALHTRVVGLQGDVNRVFS